MKYPTYKISKTADWRNNAKQAMFANIMREHLEHHVTPPQMSRVTDFSVTTWSEFIVTAIGDARGKLRMAAEEGRDICMDIQNKWHFDATVYGTSIVRQYAAVIVAAGIDAGIIEGGVVND